MHGTGSSHGKPPHFSRLEVWLISVDFLHRGMSQNVLFPFACCGAKRTTLFCESTMFWSGSKGMRLKITTMLWGFWVPLILAHAEPPAGPSTLNHETGGGRHRRGASEAKGRQGSSRGGVHPTIFPGSISHPHLHVLKLDSHVSFKVSRNFWNGIVRSQRRGVGGAQ